MKKPVLTLAELRAKAYAAHDAHMHDMEHNPEYREAYKKMNPDAAKADLEAISKRKVE